MEENRKYLTLWGQANEGNLEEVQYFIPLNDFPLILQVEQ